MFLPLTICLSKSIYGLLPHHSLSTNMHHPNLFATQTDWLFACFTTTNTLSTSTTRLNLWNNSNTFKPVTKILTRMNGFVSENKDPQPGLPLKGKQIRFEGYHINHLIIK